MNTLEKKMIEILSELKEKYGVFEIKAEFEAEGSRIEELMRLKDIASSVGLPIILKIGGVEAVTDVYNGLALGVKGIVAPMAETEYAVSKFTDLIDNYIAKDNATDIDFAVNIETITACQNLDEMLCIHNITNLSSITVGRVDLASSMKFDRSLINYSENMNTICREVFIKSKEHSLKTALGGGITTDTLPIISELNSESLIDKYETRKVVFPADSARHGEKAILKAVEFELLWLQSKRRYYSGIKKEDEKRIAMLEDRLK
jgi:4-hydroxy-2-oxoheptanedioate aldolase